jgi:signal transduction histidine kinase
MRGAIENINYGKNGSDSILRRYSLLFALLLVVGMLPAQAPKDPELDSMLHVLATSLADTNKVILLNKISSKYAQFDFVKGRETAEQARVLAMALGYKQGEGGALLGISKNYYNEGSLESALEYALKSYDIFMQIGDLAQVANASNAIGNIHADNDNTSLAAEYYRQARDIFKQKLKNPTKAVVPAHNLATLYSDLEIADTALLLFQENLAYMEANGVEKPPLMAATLHNIGNCLRILKRCDEALPYLQEAETMKVALNDVKGLGNSWCNIGHCLVQTGKLAEGERYLQKALTTGRELHRQSLLEITYQFLAEVEQKMGNEGKALEYALLCIATKDSIETETHAERVNQMQAAYEANRLQKVALINSEMQAKNELLERTNDFRLNLSIAALTGVALLICLMIALVLAYRARQRRNVELDQKNQKIEDQAKALGITNETLRDKNSRLEDLMREKDGIVDMVAHDIRSPLNRSVALAELIHAGGNLSAEQEKMIEMIKKVNHQGNQLIQDLLELNSYEQNGQPIEFQSVNLLTTLEHSLQGISSAADHKSIHIALTGESAIGSTNEMLLSRILDNLISNAVKFTPKGKAVHLGIESDDARYWIVIRDEGQGINEADQKLMFQKFQRLSARPTGGESSTGLGLSIVRALADRIGAELVFESVVGVGTTFKIGIAKAG